MIKINIEVEKRKQIEEKHLQYANEFIKKKLKQKVAELENKNKSHQYIFYKKLYNNFEDIIIGKPEILIKLVEFNDKKSKKTLYQLYDEALKDVGEKTLNKEIKYIFNYESFYKEKKLKGKYSIEHIFNKITNTVVNVKNFPEKQNKLIQVIKNIKCYKNENKNKLSKDKLDKINELEHEIININCNQSITKIREDALNNIKNLFEIEQWGAYSLLKELDIKVCPYCNRQYISIDESKKNDIYKGKTRPELDHFLCQDKFPFLSMSLYNLIPSCHVCNSNLKSNLKLVKTKAEDHIEALNPYQDGFNKNYIFSINCNIDSQNNYDFLFSNSSNFDIGFSKRIYQYGDDVEPIYKQNELIRKAEYNKKIFHLESLYNKNHKDIVMELIQIAKIYNEEYLDEIIINHPEIFNGKKDIMRLVLSNYVDQEDTNKRVLGKLVYDIANLLGILKYLE
ncbi:hypothetical protein AN1V17_42090 [Vallitalea sediminicola]